VGLIAMALLGLAACGPAVKPVTTMPTAQATAPPVHTVIPAPASIALTPGQSFRLTRSLRIVVSPGSPEALATGEFLAQILRPATGFPVPVGAAAGRAAPGSISLVLDSGDASLGDEGYALDVTTSGATIRAHRPAGLFYGAQTLRQLLPPAIEHRTAQATDWRLPAGRVLDRPRFAWRGAMLDVARHFFAVEDVKRYVDLLAKYKMNRLHLHLSDDQGWRIEITSWPRLTAHGGSTAVGGGTGGFYTQAQYRELAAYAQARHILVVPEIDVPSHTNAALASYAELNCDGVAPPLYTGIEVGFSVLCVDKDVTYKFLDDVVREIAAMTPGPYFHLGGDEVEKLNDGQFARFIERMAGIVEAHGKIPIGWDEVSKARLKPATLVQQWRSRNKQGPPPWKNEAATQAKAQNLKMVLSPAGLVYLDMKYDAATPLGLDWAGYVEVRTAYDWDPATVFEGIGEQDVAGVEAPLWTETIVTLDQLESMVFPRMPGVAEVGWSPASARSWDEYRVRLGAHAKRWPVMGVDFYRSPQVPWAAGPGS
jgi:hexosaminidase